MGSAPQGMTEGHLKPANKFGHDQTCRPQACILMQTCQATPEGRATDPVQSCAASRGMGAGGGLHDGGLACMPSDAGLRVRCSTGQDTMTPPHLMSLHDPQL